jgi:hypothetical protein
VGYVAGMGEGRVTYRVLVGKPDRRLRHRWEKLRSIFRKWDMDWIELAQNRQVAGTYECSNEPSGSIKCGEFLD